MERRYSQTEKEVLALVWACERLTIYVSGQHFKLETDHKPLERIYSTTSKPCARIKRWVLRLQLYDFKVVYRPGKANITDTLSRLNSRRQLDTGEEFDWVRAIVENSVPAAITPKEIEQASYNDEELKVWWPKMDSDVEKVCKVCHGCQVVSGYGPPEPMSRVVSPSGPWQDCSADLMGPLPSGKSILVVVDYYSRFYKVVILRKMMSADVIEAISPMFTRFGIPYSLRTDNGPQQMALNIVRLHRSGHRLMVKWSDKTGPC